MTNNILTANGGNTFKAIVLSALIVDEAGTIKCNLTDDQKAILLQRRTAENSEVSDAEKAFVKSLDIQEALNALMAPGSQQANTDIISDQIIYPRVKSGAGDATVDCAVAKTTNFCTARIIEDTVWKLYGGLELTIQRGSREMTNNIRDLLNEEFFVKAEEVTEVPDRITKRATAGDVRLSGTVFPQGIILSNELNTVLNATVALKQAMVAALYDEHKGLTQEEAICLYKNANRSMLEDIFEAEYITLIGELKNTDAEQIKEYIRLRSAYLQSLSARYGNSLGEVTVDLGLRIRKQVITKEATWTNTDKLNRVHQFQNGSYYVSNHVDAGLGKIPSTNEIVQRFADRIDDVVEASLIVIEAETRAEMGLKYNINRLKDLNLDTTKLQGPDKLFRTHLGLSVEDERDLESVLRKAACETADTVIRAHKNSKLNDAIDRLDEYKRRM